MIAGASATTTTTQDDANDAPACVIVDFGKSYTGPSCFKEGDTAGCVPIFPKTEQWETVDGAKDKKTMHSCTMIPLRLSYT